ncbi:AMP-binding protein [Mesorhizobium australicum]|uniref:AMP-binding enzyme n=1 Tax=Mesorhizobium australicum TaxID=536018 RepID=A0A1X7N266_9HYPH|nr:AMP-binding protein [Mesorhizobium australicum]SMH30922.1 AMP-binding enzyme [Mesorhizobium australicum]
MTPREIMRAATGAANEAAPLLWTHLRRAAAEAEAGGRTAVVHGATRLSYADLAARAEALAAALLATGVKTGDVVSYQLPNGIEAILVALAALRIGAVANPVIPIYRRKEVSFIVAQARPAIVFASASYRGFAHARMMVELAGPSATIVSCGGPRDGAVALEDFLSPHLGSHAAAPDAHPDADALLLYTSGTEGDPCSASAVMGPNRLNWERKISGSS